LDVCTSCLTSPIATGWRRSRHLQTSIFLLWLTRPSACPWWRRRPPAYPCWGYVPALWSTACETLPTRVAGGQMASWWTRSHHGR
jgi:hypothetical protein